MERKQSGLKDNDAKRFVLCCVFATILFWVTNAIICQGQYFKNMLTSFSLTDVIILISIWILLFALFAIGLYILKSKLCNQRNIASLYVIQFICFLVCLISRYCFKAYAFSMISCLTSIILTTVLTVKLLKEKQYYIFAVLCFYLVMLICCLFTCVIFCSLEYGVWKD